MVEVNREDVQAILAKDLNNLSEEYLSHEIVPWSDKPIGYLADHCRLRINFKSSESKDYFFKAVPKNVESRVGYMEETGIFAKEVKVYQNLITKLLECSSISWAPKCYLAKDENFIVLEILNDFKIMSTLNLTFDVPHLKVAASTLAVFHASTLIQEKKSGRKLSEDYKEIMKENAYPLTPGSVRRQGLENAIEVLSELLKVTPRYQNSPKLRMILENFPDTVRKIYKFVLPSESYTNVFNHGDLWVNNFMFKYQDEKPIECKFVDYQLARYCPPAMDLATLVYINSSEADRNQYLDDILNTYCDTLETELTNAKVNDSSEMRTQILKSFKEFHLAGLIEAALFSHLTLLPPSMGSAILSSSEAYDNFINQSRVKVCLKAFEEDYYRDRMSEILIEIVETFILKSNA